MFNPDKVTYAEAVEYIFDLERFGIKLGLERIKNFLAEIGDPQDDFPVVHVAGTNGKGSTCAMLESILSSAGYRVGLYTSPHLCDFRERMRVGRRRISENEVLQFLRANFEVMRQLPVTFFEVTTAMAFHFFSRSQVEIAVVETGLGGRLDATNVTDPECSIVTNIGLEHTEHLGSTIEEIAAEKAGIIKQGVPVVTGATQHDAKSVLRRICKKKKTQLISISDQAHWLEKRIGIDGSVIDIFTHSQKIPDVILALAGRHQLENALVAVVVSEVLAGRGWKVTADAVKRGLRSVRWPGRFQILHKEPLVIADVAHNPHGMARLRESFHELLPRRKVITVLGILSDKSYVDLLAEVGRFSSTIFLTRPSAKRAADPDILAREVARQGGRFKVIPTVVDAYASALQEAGSDDVVLVTGSHYTVGEVLGFLGAEL